MRAREVDERDVQWEVLDSDYRVVLVSDDASTWSAFDLIDCTASDALRWARDRRGSERFAVGVKVVDSAGSLGVVWLTPPPEVL